MDIQLPRNKYAFPNFYLINKRSKPTSTLIKFLFFLKPKLPNLLEAKTQRSQIYINSSNLAICSLSVIAFHDCISDYLMKTNVFFLPQLFYSAISYLGSHRNQ